MVREAGSLDYMATWDTRKYNLDGIDALSFKKMYQF